MPDLDPIAAGLDRCYRSCCQPRRHHRIESRWMQYPALAGRSIPEIRDSVTTFTAAVHNDVVADLLRAHQAGDGDATTVLLAAFIPYVCSDPAFAVGPEHIGDRWAALSHLFAVVDPDEAHRADNRPFAKVLVGRMRRWSARIRVGPDRHADPADGNVIELHARPTPPTTVEDQALARLELAAIAAHLRAGTITLPRWRRLVDDRIHGTHNRSARGAIRHTARRLAELTGHVA